jgi:excisionase family DNA binding protein
MTERSLTHMDMKMVQGIERNRYFTAKKAAEYLGLSVFSVYRLVQRRAIPFIPIRPSGVNTSRRPSVRFDIYALDAWMKKQAVKPAADYVDERGANE